jgi:hypothetical protein
LVQKSQRFSEGAVSKEFREFFEYAEGSKKKKYKKYMDSLTNIQILTNLDLKQKIITTKIMK